MTGRNAPGGVKTAIFNILLFSLFVLLFILSLNNIFTMENYSNISMRYNTSISGKTAYDARVYTVEQGQENQFWPHFWSESSATFSNLLSETRADCIIYSGDAHLIWPAVYIYGSPPGVTDQKGCAVSEALAWKLWGSLDIAGSIVEIEDEERIVRGVFEGEHELALISFAPEDISQSWNAVELSGKSENRSEAESYASAAGIGNPEIIIMGTNIFTLFKFIIYLPLIILITNSFIQILNYFRSKYTIINKLAIFILLTSAAFYLPYLLETLPSWLIPTRWSDFSFWSSLIEQFKQETLEFLSMNPLMRDVDLKMLLINQTAIGFFSICCAIIISFRQNIEKTKFNDTYPLL